MISEKIYYILFGIILFVVFSQWKVIEGFWECRDVTTSEPGPKYIILYYLISTGYMKFSGSPKYFALESDGTLIVDDIKELQVYEISVPEEYVIRFYDNKLKKYTLYKGKGLDVKIKAPVNNTFKSFIVAKAPQLNSKNINTATYIKPKGNYLKLSSPKTIFSGGNIRYYEIPESGNLEVGDIGNNNKLRFRHFELNKDYVITFYRYPRSDPNFPGETYTMMDLQNPQDPPQRFDFLSEFRSFSIIKLNYIKGTNYYSGSTTKPEPIIYKTKQICTPDKIQVPKPTSNKQSNKQLNKKQLERQAKRKEAKQKKAKQKESKQIKTPQKTPKPKVNCSSISDQITFYSNARQSEFNKNRQLLAEYKKLKKEQKTCQSSINNSINNLSPDEKNALIAAEKQSISTARVLIDAIKAFNITKQALTHQQKSSKIMFNDNLGSLETLKKANDDIEKTNEVVSKKQGNEGVLLTISDTEFFENTDLKGSTNKKWQHEWAKDLN